MELAEVGLDVTCLQKWTLNISLNNHTKISGAEVTAS